MDVAVKKVHVVQSCHLDVGFTDLSAGVVNKYLTEYIGTAVETAKQLRSNSSIPDGWGLKFMAQSYYLSFYLDCPPNMGFTCPTDQQKADLREAIARGDVTWHAFPHNAELENTSPIMLDEGLKATKTLDAAFGLPSKRSLSQRDVPGVPRSVIPVLKANGVDLVTVGVNTASMYPKVPRIFRWQDPISTEEVLAMWHPHGYGGYNFSDAVMISGWDEVLVTDWIGDNRGPGDAAHYISTYQTIQKEFPEADIVASTFDDWLDAVDKSGFREHLPVVAKEVGDSWIYGVPSDPKKTAQARALDRALTRYVQEGSPRDAPYLNFTRLAIKNCEHTWGRDVKSNLKDNANWANADFEVARTTGPNRTQYDLLEQSWWEQRRWGFEFALEALPEGHRLAELAKEEIDAIAQDVPYSGMSPAALEAAGFKQVTDPSQAIDCGATKIAFNTSTGAINMLQDTSVTPAVQWASASRPLLALGYATYSADDFHRFQVYYSGMDPPPEYFLYDFGKPNETITPHATWESKLAATWVKKGQNTTTILLQSAIADGTGSTTTPHTHYGAPEYFVTKLEVAHQAVLGADRVQVTIWCVNKTSTRLPETMFVQFTPDTTGTSPMWEMQKLGQWQKTVDDVIDGGSKHLHGVSIGSGIRFNKTVGAVQTLAIEVMDAPVINLGEPVGFPVTCAPHVTNPWALEPDVATHGVSSVFWNNLWGTNYVQWYPFNRDFKPVAGEENFISRYSLRFFAGEPEEQLV